MTEPLAAAGFRVVGDACGNNRVVMTPSEYALVTALWLRLDVPMFIAFAEAVRRGHVDTGVVDAAMRLGGEQAAEALACVIAAEWLSKRAPGAY